MSSSVAVTPGLEPILRPYPYNLLIPTKSKSCPTFGQRQVTLKEESIYSKAAQELLTTNSVAFLCLNEQTTYYCGQRIDTKHFKKLVKSKGIRVFTNEVYIHTHNTIPSGTIFLQFTTKNPLPTILSAL